jgi:hypothetical protein
MQDYQESLTPMQMREQYEDALRTWGQHPDQIAARRAKRVKQRRAAKLARKKNRRK